MIINNNGPFILSFAITTGRRPRSRVFLFVVLLQSARKMNATMHSLRSCLAQRVISSGIPATGFQKASIRFFGSRGSRGHGWYVKYRAGEGGRHLQGEYHDRESLEECQAWNAAVLGLGSTRVYMDVVVEPKKASEAVQSEEPDKPAAHMNVVPPLDSITAPIQRLEFDIATAVMPETCHNFATLIENKEYDATLLYRFEKQVGICGGDILTNTGKTGRSHRTDRLSINVKSDPLAMWHLPGTVSMLVSSVEEVDSRFFFCTELSQHLDGIHRAFGTLTPDSLATVQQWQSTLLTRGGGIPASYDIIVVKAGVASDGTSNLVVPSTPPEDATSEQTMSASP